MYAGNPINAGEKINTHAQECLNAQLYIFGNRNFSYLWKGEIMSEIEKSKTIDELSHEIFVEVLKKLEQKKKMSVMPLSTNYHCEGKGYICGEVYICVPKKDHSCANEFGCNSLYSERNYS
jgi:hypothetical protein